MGWAGGAGTGTGTGTSEVELERRAAVHENGELHDDHSPRVVRDCTPNRSHACGHTRAKGSTGERDGSSRQRAAVGGPTGDGCGAGRGAPEQLGLVLLQRLVALVRLYDVR